MEERMSPKILMQPQNSLNSKAILSKKNKADGIVINGFKIYYKAIKILKVWYWHNYRYVRISLVVQWLRLCTPNAGGLNSIPGQGTRSHMLQLKIWDAAMKIKEPACCN